MAWWVEVHPSNVSSFAVEGVNLIDASVLNSRLTYCVVQPFDSFQIILLLILTQPFIIICILPTVLKALAFIVSPMFCNPISDALYVLIRHRPYENMNVFKTSCRGWRMRQGRQRRQGWSLRSQSKNGPLGPKIICHGFRVLSQKSGGKLK